MKRIAITMSLAALLAGCGNRDEGTGTTSTTGTGTDTGSSRNETTIGAARDTNVPGRMRADTNGARTSVTTDNRVDTAKEPDNTAQNKRDQGGDTLTPGDQGSSEADRTITQQIRKSIVVEPGKDEHSLYAKNIKIITVNGEVTLRGVVKTEQEKTDIESRAKQVAGVTKVNNELEVKP